MTNINFTDKTTVVPASWLNDVNDAVYTAIGTDTVAPTTPAEVRTNLGLPSSSGASYIGTSNGSTLAEHLIFDTIAALRANTNTLVRNVHVTSYYGSNLEALEAPAFQGKYFLKTSDTTSADNGGTIIVDSIGGRWYFSKNNSTLNIQMFGAKCDGTTNDTTELNKVSQYINSLGGGVTVEFPAGPILVGKQTASTAAGQGYSYMAQDVFKLSGCTKPVTLNFNNTKVIWDSGLKFGSFDPVTHTVYNPSSLPFVNPDYQANIGLAFQLNGNKLIIQNGYVEIDGNIGNIDLGGLWGDTGRQCVHYGWHDFNNDNVVFNGHGYFHHHALDGFLVGYAELTESSEIKPHFYNQVVSEYNARQGFSYVGGNSMLFNVLKTNHTGKARFASAPGSGTDVEAESSICRNFIVKQYESINNTGTDFGADSGDSADILLENVRIIGTTQYALFANKPHIRIKGGVVSGACAAAYVGANPNQGVHFTNVLFTDKITYGGIVYRPNELLLDFSGSSNVTFDNCEIDCINSTPGYFHPTTNIINTAIKTTYTSGTAYTIPIGRFSGVNTIDLPAGLVVNMSGSKVLDGITTLNGAELNGVFSALPKQAIIRLSGNNGATEGVQRIGYSYDPVVFAANVLLGANKGDVCYNPNWSATGIEYWKCNTAPGDTLAKWTARTL